MNEKISITDNKPTYDFDALRLVEHLIDSHVAEMAPDFYSLLRVVSKSTEAYNTVRKAQLMNRNLRGRVNALAEIFSKNDALNMVRFASYDIEKFFGNIVQQMNGQFINNPENEVIFELEKNSSYSASFDARRVCIILYHLVANAMQHGKTEDKTVKIRCYNQDNIFKIDVIDHGGGVPQNIKKTIYTRFIEEVNIGGKTGEFPVRITGLGLPLCKKLVEDMNGEIKLRNFSLGAKFTISIPQSKNVFREDSEYFFEDKLLSECMATLLMELIDKEDCNQ